MYLEGDTLEVGVLFLYRNIDPCSGEREREGERKE